MIVSVLISPMKKIVTTIVATLILTAFATAAPLTVTPTPQPVNSINAGAQQQFAATSSTGTSAVVFWTVSGNGCAGMGCGNISITGGLYTAPANISSPITAIITATSTRDSSSFGSTSITVNPGSGGGGGNTHISVTPGGTVQVSAGGSQTFSATVTGPSNNAVTWSVGGFTCGASCGTINAAGVYTAASGITRTTTATVTATSQADPTASATVNVQVSPVVGITVSPTSVQLSPAGQQQFNATVTGTSIQSVRWGVSGSGCSGAACGSVSSSGFYTAPGSVSSPLQVSVTATSQADGTKSATATVTVGPIVRVSVSPSTLSLSVNSNQQYTVAVSGASNNSVTWSVSGAGCSGTACGMVAPIDGTTALYQSPSGVPSPANVNVTATLVADPTKSGSAIVTIVPSSNSRLSGPYAFLFRGVDNTGTYQAAGSFIADGNGGLNNGVEDINCGHGAMDPICASGAISGQTFTGTYTLNADGRGSFTINPAAGGSYTYALALAPSNVRARFIESDGGSIRGSGVLEPQTASAFTPSALNGGFSFSLSGTDAMAKPLAAIGSMGMSINTFTSQPVITSGVLDVNDNGAVSCFPPESGYMGGPSCPSAGTSFSKFPGTFSVGSNGRGTATFNIAGYDGNSSDTSVFNFSMYVVSANEVFLLSMDDPVSSKNPVFSGQVLKQILPQPGFPFQQGQAVISWTGVIPGSRVPLAAVGQIMFDDNGDITNLDIDQNTGGSTTYWNGRGLCNGQNRLGLCTFTTQNNQDVLFSANTTQLRAFPTAPNSGFVLGMGPAVTVGKIEAQVPGSFPLPFMFGSDLMTSASDTIIAGTGSLGQSSGRLAPVSGNKDESMPSMFAASVPLNGTYGPPTLPNGQGLIYLNSPGVPSLDLWVASPYKSFALEVDPNAVPDVIVFEH